jgi:pheromone shutdown-related protein TraB
MVCVELDSGRYAAMTRKDNWERLDIIKVIREGKGFLLIANLALSSFQHRLGGDLGVSPGEEMRTAVSAAEEIGSPFAFCDREVQLTLRRAWSRCGFWSKCKLIASLFASVFAAEKLSEADIENLKNKSELDGMMGELARYLPEIKETLIDERDRCLAAHIWENAAVGGKTAAVVGAGHLAGLRTEIGRIAAGEADADVSALEAVPAPKPLSKAAGWLVPVLIVAIIAAGFLRNGADVSGQMLLRWVLWNGSLAAVGAIAALAHPLAVLVSFLGAPIATLNPFIGVGLFSGAVQAALRRPRVADAENLNTDIGSLRGIYANRITRALLVFFLSSVGGAVGNFISIPTLAGFLFK